MANEKDNRKPQQAAPVVPATIPATVEAASTTPVATATKPRVMVTFIAPWQRPEETDTAKAPGDRRKAEAKTLAIATCMIEGLFVEPFTMLCAHEVKLAMVKADRTLMVYLPSSGPTFQPRPHIGPRMRKLDTPVRHSVGGRDIVITHVDDPEAVKQSEKFKAAIIDAWIELGTMPDGKTSRPLAERWGIPVPLSI